MYLHMTYSPLAAFQTKLTMFRCKANIFLQPQEQSSLVHIGLRQFDDAGLAALTIPRYEPDQLVDA